MRPRGSQSRTAAYAAFSLPRQAENRRGYVCYTIAENVDGYPLDTFPAALSKRTAGSSPGRLEPPLPTATGPWVSPKRLHSRIEDEVEGAYSGTASQP